MALAEYFERSALAAAQVLRGFDGLAFRSVLESTTVGLALDHSAVASAEGRAIADLVIRLIARLYPAIELDVPPGRVNDELRALAMAINPRLEWRSDAAVGICVGTAARRFQTTIFAGSDGCMARVGTAKPYQVGESNNPFGAGVAACLAVANLFRLLFVPTEAGLDSDISFSAFGGDGPEGDIDSAGLDGSNLAEPVLVGLGAIGNAAAWALARTPFFGALHLVDHQSVELSNVQRYVLTTPADVGRLKIDVIAEAVGPSVNTSRHPMPWAAYAEMRHQSIADVLVALDSAKDRRAVQATLPRSIVNAWTQPGDLGVSTHGTFGTKAACLACLYTSDAPAPNEDEIVADALGIVDQQLVVRQLLHSGDGVSADLLELIAERLGVETELAKTFQGQPVRLLYAAACGGAIIPLERLGAPRPDMHVPLAHQSALAGVLLAAAYASAPPASRRVMTEVLRINVLRSLGTSLRQPMAAQDAGRCICRDLGYVRRYRQKWMDDDGSGPVQASIEPTANRRDRSRAPKTEPKGRVGA